MSPEPAAFLSYVRFDDQHEDGRLTQFREHLSGEMRLQTGEKFEIFQDRNAIAWGEQWQQRIDGALDAVTFLIPIVTPGFLKSPACRSEFERFLQREAKLGRRDLILPVYYVNCPILSDEAKLETDEIARTIASRQFADWRELRFEPFTSPQIGKAIAKLAEQVVESLGRERSTQAVLIRETAGAQDEAGATETSSSPEEAAIHLTGTGQRPAYKSEPPTRIVDALHRGNHATLSDALKAAEPGDRILVRPGFYQEGIVIDKPVEIIGDGELGEVVIEATGKDTVAFATNMARIANLTLRQTGGGDWYCVDIAQGRLDLEGCDITCQSLSCVAIHEGADPRLRRNRIHDANESGVHVYDNGQATLEDNDIFANAIAGVAISTSGNPTLRRNRIHDGKSGGVSVYDNGQGTLEDNDIFANAHSGVAISTSGNPTLRRNRIHDGKRGGVFVYDNGAGTLEDNDIFANAGTGVEIRTGSNPTLCRNRIHDGKGSGVLVHDNGQGTLEDNDIFANARSGVAISTSGNPTLRRNRIHDGKSGGVHVYDNGQATLEDNDIFANAGTGVEIRTGGNPTLCRNRIHDEKGSGVLVHDNGQGTLEDNDIFANANAGVTTREGGNPRFRANRISQNGTVAVRVYSGGQGVFEDNDLRGNVRGAWYVSEDCGDKVVRHRNQE